jgi:hypothetical protein
MKKITVLLFLAFGFNSFSQVSFGLNMSKNTNSAQFGYVYKRFNPYAAFQYTSVKGEVNAKLQEFDPFDGEIYSTNLDLSAKLSMIMPTIGLKFFAVERNKLKAFANVFYSKPMLRAKLDIGFPEFESEVDRVVRDIKFNSFGFGVGAEYFFDPNFSIGGEFGFMSTRMKTSIDFTQEAYDFNTGDFVTLTNTIGLKAAMSPTYARLSLNFYFGK